MLFHGGPEFAENIVQFGGILSLDSSGAQIANPVIQSPEHRRSGPQWPSFPHVKRSFDTGHSVDSRDSFRTLTDATSRLILGDWESEVIELAFRRVVLPADRWIVGVCADCHFVGRIVMHALDRVPLDS